MKIKSPDNSQKEGKKTFFPTMGSIIVLKLPIADSTMSCPLLGINRGVPTVNLTSKIINKETTQLVTIELVTGSGPKRNNSSDVRLTPFPAAKAPQEKNK